jgi:hypothetical protein
LGSAGVEDPLDQRQSIGWKMTGFGTKVLLPEAIVNYWSVATNQADTPAEIEAPEYDYAAEATALNVTVTFANATGQTVLAAADPTPIKASQNLSQAIVAAANNDITAALEFYFDAAATQPAALNSTFFVNTTIFVKAVA